MESNTNVSQVSVQFGQVAIDGKQPINVKLSVHFGAHDAKNHVDKMTKLTGSTESLDHAAIIVLTPTAGNKDKLVDFLKSTFDGTAGSRMSKDLSEAIKGGYLTQSVVSQDNKVYIILKPGPQIATEIEAQITSFINMGASSVINTQDNKFSVTLSSNNSLTVIDNTIKEKNYTFAAELLTSFRIDLVLNLNQNLVPKLLEIATAMEPSIGQSPLPMLAFFKNLVVDLQFDSTEELPEYFRGKLMHKLKEGMAASATLPDKDKDSVKKLAEYIDNPVEVYAVSKELMAIHLHVSVAGFAGHFTSKLQ